MGFSLGAIEFYAGPPVLGGPDDLDAVIREFIDGAQQKLLIAVQELDSRTVTQAILNAARRPRVPATTPPRGVSIQLILESSYLTEDKPPLTNLNPPDPWVSAGDNEENRQIHAALLRAGIDVITDLNPEIFHQKFVVRDPGTQNAAVLTGSTNFTLTDTGTNPPGADPAGNNLNHVVILHGKQVADTYQDEFTRLRSGTFGDLHERVEPRPKELRLATLRVKPIFAPQQGPEMEIMKQMLKASQRIDFAMFTFAQSSGIDDTMIRLVSDQLPIRGVLDHGQGVANWAATPALKAAGVQLFTNKASVRKLHHKLMVIDDQLIIVGSFNYTGPAATLNDENIVVIGDLEEADPTAKDNQHQLAMFARTEIDRIIHNLAKPV